MPILIGPSGQKTKERSFPFVPIRNGVVFPNTDSVLTFGRDRSLAAVEQAFKTDRLLVISMQKDAKANDPGPNDVYLTGTLCHLDRLMRGKNEINALVKGIGRVEITNFTSVSPYLNVTIRQTMEIDSHGEEVKALSNHLTNEFRKAVNLGKSVDFLVFMNIASGGESRAIADQIASSLNLKPKEKQSLLEMNNVKQRLEKINELLAKEINVLKIERDIASRTKAKFDKNAREAVLRERMQMIQKELGEEEGDTEVVRLKKKIAKAGMPKEVQKKAEKEVKRLQGMATYNPERGYLLTYLEVLTDLPWNRKSSNDVDMQSSQKVLDTDHYGLEKIKERIIEYLAVLKLKKKRKSKDKEAVSPTILCFVGPPGVGKTSLGRSIARALKRKFVRMSLGGIRDEAEIRGHRRTYVGALPGRIIQGIRQAETRNPVFMLDEIDKVGTDFRGDPSAALLEALDPEQNHSFSDHYLEVAFDLSEVMFITTCNILDTIPPALRDRLEIIHFPGYTEDEKFHIGRDFLISKQLRAHGLSEKEIILPTPVLRKIIRRYTREAGVRDLERQLAKIMRKTAKKIASGWRKKIAIGASDLTTYLGPTRFSDTLAEKKDEVGMSTGLAWTEAGGDVLFIEVALMPGKGNLTLTGHLGEVMRESCKAASSYVRSRWSVLGLKEKFYHQLDIHVHVPEGAVPKDGPSAGIAITAALVSALTQIPVRRDVGMTGEITLRGRVLEIGGVKEKVIAAHRAGLKTIIMPKDNKKDLADIPKKVTRDLKFVFAEHMDEVLKVALGKEYLSQRRLGAENGEEMSRWIKTNIGIPARPLHLPLRETSQVRS